VQPSCGCHLEARPVIRVGNAFLSPLFKKEVSGGIELPKK
jgi:hypothetical protein